MSYLNHPLEQKGFPSGLPYIVANEAAERFSFYGMRTILVVFMTQYLLSSNGQLAVMSEHDAKGWYHLFVSAVYLTPLLGAVIADLWWGKYRTIIFLSLIYCAGHLTLAIDDTRLGLAIGLGLIALGAGGIKPCVSAHLGDQFGQTNRSLISRAFAWFYMSINIGAFVSTLLTPWLLHNYGAGWAFGIPGVLMGLATLFFWLGRYKFVHIAPTGPQLFPELIKGENLRIMGRLGILYLFVAIFWSLFDQTGSSWVLQAKEMDRYLLGMEILPAQIQAANPLLIILLIPVFSYVIYPGLDKIFHLTSLRKIAIGFFLAALAFSVTSLAQEKIDAGQLPSIAWQLFSYLLLTSAEVMVSITALDWCRTLSGKSFSQTSFFKSRSSIGGRYWIEK